MRAIRIGEVKTPIMAKIIPMIPETNSFLVIDINPKINAKGLRIGDKIKIPINPKIMLSNP